MSNKWLLTCLLCSIKKTCFANNFSAQSAQSLHGDIPQKQRELTLKGFRNGNFEVLVATNVAARGLDIPEVDLVVQCSPPKVSKTLLLTYTFAFYQINLLELCCILFCLILPY